MKLRTYGLGLVLAVLAVACTPANGSELPRKAPRFHPNRTLALVAVGPDLVATVTWTPGTTDSITFTVTGDGAATATSLAPFADPEVDSILLGPRPLPGVTNTYDIAAAGTYVDRANRTPFSTFLGSVSWTEPQPAGVAPNFGPPGIDTTDGSAPQASLLELAIWPDSVTVDTGATIQFCALGRLSTDSTTWVALPGTGGQPIPAVCLAAAAMRNPPAEGGSIG